LCKALVKFKVESEAEAFLVEHPVIDILDEPVWVERGFEHSEDDWQCSGCKSLNFSHREACFKCRRRRRRKASFLPGNEDISPIPSNFLLIQGIEKALSGEQVCTVHMYDLIMPNFIPLVLCLAVSFG
jgi:hypothetical protein